MVATNALDALRALNVLPASVAFVSGNWPWINPVMDPLGVPRIVQAFLFLGAMAWEALAALLHWRALARREGRPLVQEPATVWACTVSLALWAPSRRYATSPRVSWSTAPAPSPRRM